MTEDQHYNLDNVWKFLTQKCEDGKDWHLSYGLTENRAMALFGPPKNSGSLKNPNSETALTIFLLGHLNKWAQPESFGGCKDWPRKENKRLNRSFFKKLCENAIDGNEETFFEHIVKDPKSSKSRLLFEIGVPNIAFRREAGEQIKSSFINNETSNAWSQFDAMLLVPEGKRVIGIEAKLSSDISIGTTNHSYVNQIIRNLEAGYWLTNCGSSLFSDPDSDSKWTFEYVFICPKNAMEYKATHYSHILTDKEKPCVQTALDNYKNYLCAKKLLDKKVDKTHFERFNEHFTNTKNNHITVHYWSELTEELHNRVSNPLKSRVDDDFKKAVKDRLKLADVPCCHYSVG